MIVIASDHAGFALKAKLVEHFKAKGLPYNDLGTYGIDKVDYPDYAHNLCSTISCIDVPAVGILICGTGIGMAITANRHNSIRCAVTVTEEMARLARLHNNANVIALGARIIDDATAIGIVDVFLATDYEGGRHAQRLDKINIQVGFDSGFE